MLEVSLAIKFAADMPVALQLGGQKAFVKALNQLLRETGMFRPVSGHKEIRKAEAKNAHWHRQNSTADPVDSVLLGSKKTYKEFGEIREPEIRVKPSPRKYQVMSNGLKRKKISPISAHGKRLIRDAKSDDVSHLKVGTWGWWQVDHDVYYTQILVPSLKRNDFVTNSE